MGRKRLVRLLTRLRDGGAPRGASGTGAARTAADIVEDGATGLSALAGIGVALWLIGAAAVEFSGDVSWWWHGRVAADLIVTQATVRGHDLDVFSSDGSWAHKNNPSTGRQGSWYASPVLAIEYPSPDGGGLVRTHIKIPETYYTRDAAVHAMVSDYSVGGPLSVSVHPNDVSECLVSAEETPTFLGLAGRLFVHIIYFVFIQLPLVVLFALFLGPAVGWVVTTVIGLFGRKA